MLIDKTRLRPRKGLFFGWWIVAAGFWIQMLQSSLFFNSFGAYFVYLQAEFGWSRTVLSGAFSLQQLEGGLLGPLQGWLVERFGPRAVVRVGAVIAGAGLILLSQVHSAWQFYAAFLVVALGSSVGGFLALFSTVANWFQRRRSQAMGIMMCGMSVGGLLVPVIAWFLSRYDWRPTAFVSGLIIVVASIPAAQVLQRTPEECGYLPDGIMPEPPAPDAVSETTARSSAEVREADPSFTVREALRTKAFWCISIAHAAALLVVSALMVHLIPHLVERLGFSVQIAGTMVSLMTAVMILSQLFGGALGDRIDKRRSLTLCLLGHAVALFGLAFSSAIWQVALFVVIHGLAWGARVPMVLAIRADYFGRASFATIMGFSSAITMMGMMAGPVFAGSMADAAGDYRLAFSVLASIAGLSSVLFLLARRPEPPSRLRSEIPMDS